MVNVGKYTLHGSYGYMVYGIYQKKTTTKIACPLPTWIAHKSYYDRVTIQLGSTYLPLLVRKHVHSPAPRYSPNLVNKCISVVSWQLVEMSYICIVSWKSERSQSSRHPKSSGKSQSHYLWYSFREELGMFRFVSLLCVPWHTLGPLLKSKVDQINIFKSYVTCKQAKKNRWIIGSIIIRSIGTRCLDNLECKICCPLWFCKTSQCLLQDSSETGIQFTFHRQPFQATHTNKTTKQPHLSTSNRTYVSKKHNESFCELNTNSGMPQCTSKAFS